MKTEETVSVIIPVFNGEKFIAEAIESVLGQSIKPSEVIVVNDGSTDETEGILKKFGESIQYINQANAGSASARNKGLQIAQSNVIGFLDADDIWVKDKLEKQLNLFRKNPQYEMVIGLLCRIPYSKTDEVLNQKKVKGEYVLQLGSVLIQKRVFDQIGNFDESMLQGEDVDLFLRILEAGIKVWGHPDVVQYYRRHDRNLTLNEKQKNFYLLKAYKKSLDRRRKSGNKDIEDLPRLGNIDEIMKYWRSN
jgi:glycosyltransferase involved in cell wall biosynthesis